jgi:hypothetical protein
MRPERVSKWPNSMTDIIIIIISLYFPVELLLNHSFCLKNKVPRGYCDSDFECNISGPNECLAGLLCRNATEQVKEQLIMRYDVN